ncbi:MAG TPA: MopE-related protein [Sedimentisphaerales bacterium]|nr:MopE-related protein [Sedimentisphaerales bacterium]
MAKQFTILSIVIMLSFMSVPAQAVDTDRDGIADPNDNCWYVINPDQTDSDSDCPAQPFASDPECGNACDDYCQYVLIGDLDYDCKVDFRDFALLLTNWLVDCNSFPENPACISIIVDNDGDGWDSSVDCNDFDPNVYPGATEIVGDGIDQDCDSHETCYLDADDDGYRPDAISTVVSGDMDCMDPGEAAASDPTGDCDDAAANVHPGATEIVDNGIDEDCDSCEMCYLDADDDGYRPDAISTVVSGDMDCMDSGEATASDPTGDCDDTAANVHPWATEIVDNGIDEDCDSCETCYRDADDDGYRPDAISTVVSGDMDCTDSGEANASDPTGDCDDSDPAQNPGQTEICDNGEDDDCDGLTDSSDPDCSS